MTGKITPLSLYTFLFNHRQKGVILVFDDIDVFSDDDIVNIFKGALNGDEPRMITWESSSRTVPKPRNMSDEEFYTQKDHEFETLERTGDTRNFKPPSQFRFQASIVFITNEPMEKILGDPNLSAVASRALGRVDFDFDSNEIIAKMEMVWKNVRPDVPDKTRRAILDMIIERHRTGVMSQISMRQMTNAFNMAAAGKTLPEIARIIGY